MNPKEESRMVWAFFIAFMAIIAVSLLFGCKTQKVVETVIDYVHDTVQVHHSDTVREVKVTHHTDTVRQLETHTYTINNVGDTVKEIHHYNDVWHTTVVDSTYRYKARMDSLERALEVEKAKEKISVKGHIPKWVWIVSIANLFLLFLFFGKILLPLLKKKRE